jgi:hypothetical protein
MKRIIKLTEADLTRIVKRVIKENNHYERDYDYILDELGKYGLHPYSGWFEEFENSRFYEPEMSDEEYVDVIYDFIINGDNEY